MDLRLDLRLTQKLVMTPQLQQAIKLLQLSRLELQQVLSEQLVENPLLEEELAHVDDGESSGEDDPAQEKKEESEELVSLEGGEGTPQEFSEPLSSEEWDTYYENDWRTGAMEYTSSSDEEFPSYEHTLTKPTSLEEHLLWQLRLSTLEGRQWSIGRMVIGNLDEDGYFRVPLSEIAEDAHVPVDDVESVLTHIQMFDPPGIAARDLQECLLIQLNHLEGDPIGNQAQFPASASEELAKRIVINHLQALQKKRYESIAKALRVPFEHVCHAVHIIEGLEPKPGRPYSADHNHVIIPDVFVGKEEGEWVIMLNEEGFPRIRINPYYKRMMANRVDDGGVTKAYLEEKLRGAQWIIRSIDQRNKTIVKVVKSLVQFQEPFLEKGIQYLKPLVLKQVAEDVGMHESTISRVTTNKYMDCPQGILELKFFFNAAIQCMTPGAEDLSSTTVREFVRESVANEDPRHPLKDQEIMARLRKRDIIIARRTVAKYRVELNIAPVSQRKRIL